MKLLTLSQPDSVLWPAALSIYHEAFPEVKKRKPDRIIEGMFGEGQGLLHAMIDEETGEALAFAFTGVLTEARVLLIDYLAVREAGRGRGLGKKLVEEIKREAELRGLNGLLIEVESEETEENLDRIRFWLNCGFRATEYVHQYKWVPEPYRAMTFALDPARSLPEDGEELFRWIEGFHARAYRRKKID